jgi:hypothetical protein
MPVIINGTTGISGVDGSAGTPAFQGSDANTGIRFGTDIVSLVTGGSDRLYIDSSGRLGIGSTAPIAATHIMLSDVTGFSSPANDGLVVERGGGNDLGITIATNNDRNGYLLFADSDSANPAWVGYDHSVNAMSFRVNASERARIDSSGRLLVGTSTSIAGQAIQAATSGGNSFGGFNFSNTDDGGELVLGKSRSATIGSHTVVQNNDFLGRIFFNGSDGSAYRVGARIDCQVDGTPGANDLPSRLVFSTTADGASSPTERMRIANDGSISSVIPGGSTLYPRFGCRAWVNFNGTGTVAIRASGNVSSITDNGTGDYTVNFTSALADANYSTVVSAGRTTGGAAIASPSYSAAPTVNGVQIAIYNTSGTLTDVDRINVAVFR